jgi:hypothetical protein
MFAYMWVLWEPRRPRREKPMNRFLRLALASLVLFAPACAVSSGEGDGELEGPLDQVPEAIGESMTGPVAAPGAASEVWSVTNAWMDKSTPEAKKAGIAWDAGSGLTWEEKYARWIGSMKKIPSDRGWGESFEIPTPYGARTLHAPTLECAEVALLLRVTFASWYHLPFYLTGWDAASKRSLYAGHFGFVYSDGSIAKGFPAFKTRYKDFEKTWKEGQSWPKDAALRSLHLGSDDGVPFLEPGAGAGAYFDELFLNKRVGYFARLLLLYFGSVNLADPANTIHIKPEATSAGDVLLERWQKKGIGHTIPVLHVEPTAGEHFAIDVASGSMPRRQPVWEGPEQSRWSFTNPMTGGRGQDSEGNPYAKLGGGIRRWRTPVLRGGRWNNEISTLDKGVYIPHTDLAAIEARPERFAVLLSEGTPEEQRAALVARIEAARLHLRAHPASCSARANREDAFEKLYVLSRREFGMDKAAVDAAYRTLEDAVFADLTYDKSKTCCWNTTTAAMGDIVLEYAKAEQAAAAAKQMCANPTVFKASGGGDGYSTWANYAKTVGRASDWRAWSEDEPCPQRAVAEDTLSGRAGVPWCSIAR